MKVLIGLSLLAVALFSLASTLPEAPTGFDNKTNGLADDATHAADQVKFDEIEQISDGLGPLDNAQSCRDRHQHPTSGRSSLLSVRDLRHRRPHGQSVNPD